ncbi:MAG: lipid-A-disaccharide synthase [Magnetococcales bacterium]|nr:lipid-A-disaccharide synthase [Magnetococcales bacterium]
MSDAQQAGGVPPPKICMVVGEASGDFLGAELLVELRERYADLEAFGVGGPKMDAVGFDRRYEANDLSVIGLVEVFRNLPRLYRVFRHLVQSLKSRKPDLLITIDLPDFNFMLARRARKMGITVVHYVSPQVWAWRSGRVKKIAGWVDHLLALFPFEPEIYAESGLPVTFVGHPMVQRVHPSRSVAEIRQDLGLEADQKLVTLLPGSRLGEISRLLPVMLESARKLMQRRDDLRFALGCADTVDPDTLRVWIAGYDDLRLQVRSGQTFDLMAASNAAIIASGTATLEAALLETPMVVIYRVNRVTYEIGRRVIQVPHIALANIVAGRELVPERVQQQASPAIITEDIEKILDDPEISQRMCAGFREIRERLSPPPERAGHVVAGLLERARNGRLATSSNGG